MQNVVMVTHFKGVPLTDLTALILSIMVEVEMDVSLWNTNRPLLLAHSIIAGVSDLATDHMIHSYMIPINAN